MRTQDITPELRAWIIAQAEAGHSPQSVLTAMRASGWAEDVALAAMEEVLQHRADAVKLAAKPMPDIVAGQPNGIRAHDRDKLSAYLKEKGVASGVHYPVPLHLQKSFAYLGNKRGDFLGSKSRRGFDVGYLS